MATDALLVGALGLAVGLGLTDPDPEVAGGRDDATDPVAVEAAGADVAVEMAGPDVAAACREEPLEQPTLSAAMSRSPSVQ